MELNEIIKDNSDRLFIVDTECFIIFTGDSIEDDRPFIRIGTWFDLPVEIIPLIENIIITDNAKGDPSHEQFNIDIRHLTSNRYIGSEISLKRFLDYQRNFGLDLTNVSVVNVDKDVPELPKKRNISDRDHFIGVFYSNGDIKIVHSGLDIFGLQRTDEEYPDISTIHKGISEISKESERYRNSGFIIFDANPIFYSNGFFTSYQYPGNYYSRFSRMQIDPAKIRELILPSQNISNISGLLKYKNSREGKIRLFSDNIEQTDLIKKLFKNATILDEKFSFMNYNTGDGLKIESLGNNPNLKLTYRKNKNQSRDISITFIKSHIDAKSALKEKSDAIIITYTAYEESSLLFASTNTPVLILNDGNPNIKKLYDIDRDILINGIQYEFVTHSTIKELSIERMGDNDLLQSFSNSQISEIESRLDSISQDPNDWLKLFNTLSLLKVHIKNTTDRKVSSSLKSLYRKYIAKLNLNLVEEKSSSIKSIIVFHNNCCYQFLEEIENTPDKIYSETCTEDILEQNSLYDEQKKLCIRIIEDRIRLNLLINLFYEKRKDSESYNTIQSEINKLSNEIKTRKEIYSQEIYLDETNTIIKSAYDSMPGKIKNNTIFRNNKKQINGHTDENKVNETRLASLWSGNKKYIAAIILILIILSILGYNYLYTGKEETVPIKVEDKLMSTQSDKDKNSEITTVTRINSEEKMLLKKIGVKISNLDIYNYANDVAEKNGYAKISYQGFKSKNPHWIYPTNLFIMLDGEKVVVQKGDTLWDLSKAKLEKMNAEFYKIVEEIDSLSESDKGKIEALIKKADSLAYIEEQKKTISRLKKKYLNEQ